MACLGPVCCSGAWRLVWSDEFDYEGLPDPARWTYEEGFVRNEEAQYYTRARKENARVENGMLVIEGRREPFPNPRYREGAKNWQQQRKSASYTAASVTTEGKSAWRYGRIEVRAKLPQGLGVWPAIWMLGANHRDIGWPRCGEIDIMEFVGHDPRLIHGNAHYYAEGAHRSDHGKLKTEAPYDDFHVYAIEWDENRLAFFFDETRYHVVTLDQAGEGPDNPFRKPQYLLINLALGGTWGREIDDSIFPQKYLVDYVRVYEEEVVEEQEGKATP